MLRSPKTEPLLRRRPIVELAHHQRQTLGPGVQNLSHVVRALNSESLALSCPQDACSCQDPLCDIFVCALRDGYAAFGTLTSKGTFQDSSTGHPATDVSDRKPQLTRPRTLAGQE